MGDSTSENMPKNVVSETDCGTIAEGKAEILLHKKNVFYNPVQEFNRDLSIVILAGFIKSLQTNPLPVKASLKSDISGLRVLEALSATGLRSIRYAKEVPGITEIIANDISSEAVDSIRKNIIHNQVDHIVKPSHEDAIMTMYQNKKFKFDVVDLDPYGCPSMFLDAAVQSVKEGGLMFVTATDMAVLAGNSPETCYVKYGAISLKSKACHEIALRILLQNIAAHAGRHGKIMTPLLSVSADFYIRVFVKLQTSPSGCKKNTSKLGLLYQCTGCKSRTVQPLGSCPTDKSYKLPHAPVVEPLCVHCKQKHLMGGPIWLGPLHNKEFITQLMTQVDNNTEANIKALRTLKRIQGILHVISEELEAPLYYTLDDLMSTVKSHMPPMVIFRSAIINAGYKVSYSHANKISIKTDAPNHVIWDIVRAWEKANPINRKKIETNNVALEILNTKPTTSISFKKHPDAVPGSQSKGLLRFQQNPAYWGPGTRSTMMIDRGNEKSKLKQNKKRKLETNKVEVVQKMDES